MGILFLITWCVIAVFLITLGMLADNKVATGVGAVMLLMLSLVAKVD